MTDDLLAAPCFMTHHSPVGAWSSLTFGLPGKGVSIDHESPNVEETADFLIALSRGPGRVKALPFVSGVSQIDNEARQTTAYLSPAETGSNAWQDLWTFVRPPELKRRLSPGIDEYSAGDFVFRVLTPHPALPDPANGGSLAYPCCPGILLELTVDNSAASEPAHGFIGLAYKSRGRIRPLDWSTGGALSGIALSGHWALAAKTVDEEVFTVRDNYIANHVIQGRKTVHPGGQEGGILFRVPPGQKKTLTAAFGFYHEGNATQVIAGRYFYTKYFDSVEAVCAYLLDNADRIREDCRLLDQIVREHCGDERKRQIFSQAIRAYYASTQLLEAEGKPLYNVAEGQYLWRNTLDLAVDHLPFELRRNPWVLRNIMDLYIDRYAYRDEIRFREEPGKRYPGGLSFTHDMGNHSAYAPPGMSGYEQADSKNYGFMTTEELLNGIYGLTAYVLAAKDREWAERRSGTALELLASMENRDHHDPKRRDGILKGESLNCGENGREITTYDCLDHSLLSSVGNLYIAVKTLCAARLLAAYFRILGLGEAAGRAKQMADKTEKSLVRFFDEEAGCFKANLYTDSASKVMAAVEPFAVPLFLGLKESLFSEKVLPELFRRHIRTCLVKNQCLDGRTEGLRLSSASANTWPSKTVLCLYVLEELFETDLDGQYPSLMRELLHWLQVSAAEKTVSDQIDCTQRTVIGASYYPRIITSSLWVFR